VTLLHQRQAGPPPSQGPLVDAWGRTHTYLRVSLTDRCNYRCTYCAPEEGFGGGPRAELLAYEEVLRLVRVMARMGIERGRLTGGEPLARRGVVHGVALLGGLGLTDLSMTTNGSRLARWARPLARAGLKRVNISLDTLRPDRFTAITRGGRLADVLEGIDAARQAGLTPLKINAVLVRGENDDEAAALVDWARAEGLRLRFIEAMPFSSCAAPGLSGAEVRQRLGGTWTPLGRGDGGPATRFRHEATGQVVGFISPQGAHFCEACNRLRLSAQGELRTCLSREAVPSLRGLLRSGAGDDTLEQAIRAQVWGKVAGHEAHLGTSTFEGIMTHIGG